MPRFHFNVFDADTHPDTVGTVLDNTQHARRDAFRLASDLLRTEAMAPRLHDDWRVEVTDDRGLILFRVDILLNEAAAMGRTH